MIAGVAALFLALTSFSAGTSPDASARSRYRKRTTRVAAGMTLTRMVDRRGPNRIKILRMKPASQLTLDVALANEKLPGHETTSSMASRKGAVAAINGDFTLLPSDAGAGRPVDLFAEDGELLASPLIWGRNFAISHDESQVFVGHPKLKMSLRQQDLSQVWKVMSWNEGTLEDGEFGAYTSAGGAMFQPPKNACSVRLLPTEPFARAWAREEMDVQEAYSVDALRCASSKRMQRKGGVVVSARPGSRQAEKLVGQLTPGEPVALTWSSGWPGILDTIGGNPTLLENGVNTIGPCDVSYFCRRNPRSGVGVTAAGDVLLVTVDGRRDGSVGMTLPEFARLFRHLGATSALNLDGGGSTTMWVRGRLVNRPSGGYERPVGSALLVLPGADPGEVAPGPEPTPIPSATPSPTPSVLPSPSISIPPPVGTFRLTTGVPYVRPEQACRSLHDAGSTGGFLDALASGAFGPPRRLPGDLRVALDVYRGSLTCAAFRATSRP